MWNSSKATTRLKESVNLIQSDRLAGPRDALFLHHFETFKLNAMLRDFELEGLAAADRIAESGAIILLPSEMEHYIERRLKGIFLLGVVVGLLGQVPEPMKQAVQGTNLVNTILISPN